MTESTQIAAFGGKVTLKAREGDQGKGSQNISTEDLATPQLKLLQLISPECSKRDAGYVEGAEAGMILNTATRELHNAVFCMNLHYKADYNIWNSDDELVGVFESEEEAKAHIEAEGLDPHKNNIVRTPTHLLMLLDESGTPTGSALLYMSKSKDSVSRAWNTLIHAEEKKGKARFGHIWRLDVVLATNKKNQEYFNLSPKMVCEAPDELYNAAKAEYDAFFGTTQEEAPAQAA